MDFITATFKNAAAHGITPEEADVKAFQITEENKKLIGVEVAGFYYVTQSQLEYELIPDDGYYSFTLELYSDTNMVRAEIGDWFTVHNRKYRLELQWIGKESFEAQYDVPVAIEPPVIDREIPDHVVDEIIPEVTNGAE